MTQISDVDGSVFLQAWYSGTDSVPYAFQVRPGPADSVYREVTPAEHDQALAVIAQIPLTAPLTDSQKLAILGTMKSIAFSVLGVPQNGWPSRAACEKSNDDLALYAGLICGLTYFGNKEFAAVCGVAGISLVIAQRATCPPEAPQGVAQAGWCGLPTQPIIGAETCTYPDAMSAVTATCALLEAPYYTLVPYGALVFDQYSRYNPPDPTPNPFIAHVQCYDPNGTPGDPRLYPTVYTELDFVCNNGFHGAAWNSLQRWGDPFYECFQH